MTYDALLFVLLLLVLGKACAHWRVFPPNAAEVLNLFARAGLSREETDLLRGVCTAMIARTRPR